MKQTTDDKPNANELFRRPLHGLDHIRVSKPSAKALGYFRSVRFADEDQLLLQQSHLRHRLVDILRRVIQRFEEFFS